MPNRILRDGINSSARVNRLSPDAEVLYRRLMSVADDYGRYYANPATVRGACWPTHPSPPCEQVVSKLLAECQQGARSLLTVYVVDGCSYLQINDFNQKVRSKSKFPEPVGRLPADCQQIADNPPALDVVRSRSSESEAQSEAANARADDAFQRFEREYRDLGGAHIRADFMDALWVWNKLDWEQRAARVKAVAIHAAEYKAAPRFIPKPRKFLDSEWERPPKPPPAAPHRAMSATEKAIATAKARREAERVG